MKCFTFEIFIEANRTSLRAKHECELAQCEIKRLPGTLRIVEPFIINELDHSSEFLFLKIINKNNILYDYISVFEGVMQKSGEPHIALKTGGMHS